MSSTEHPKSTKHPEKNERVQCNWCKKKLLGNNFPNHVCISPSVPHMSYNACIQGVSSITTFFGSSTGPLRSSNQDIAAAIAKDDAGIRKLEDELSNEVQTDDAKNSNAGNKIINAKKRNRQRSLFESFGKLAEFERVIGDMINKIEDPEQEDYLTKLKDTLTDMKKAANDIKQYKERKKRRYEEIQSLRDTMEISIQDQKLLQRVNEKHEAEILALKREDLEDNIVTKKELAKVELEYQQIVKDTLQKFPSFQVSDDGKFIECVGICEANWEKAKLPGEPSKTKIKINRNVKQNAKRHVIDNRNHHICDKAADAFQLNKDYFEGLLNNMADRVEKITDNVIRIIYFVIQENLALSKSEALFDLFDLCEAAVGNQLHSRVTGAAITLCVDEVFHSKLTKWMFADKKGPVDLMMIGDKMTDEGGIKTLNTKFGGFENMELREMLYTVIESTGTSEDLERKFLESLMNDIKGFTGLSEEQTMAVLKNKLKGCGSDRASKMLKFLRLLGEDMKAFVLYHCDNHMTESAYDMVQNEVNQLENVE